MDKQLEFSFDNDEIIETDKSNSLYDYCISNNRLDLLDEFDNEKNSITPKEVLYSSTKKIYWKCKKDGYIFKLSPNARTNFYNSGCPLCANKVVGKGVNDFETKYPNLAILWDDEKNGDKKPYMYSSKSEEVFCFKCSKGHSYESSIKKLISDKGVCPICAKRKIIKGYNDIFTLYPKLKKEWDYDKNKDIDPYKLRKNSRKKIWLICAKNHSYDTTVINKIKNHYLCPYCTLKKPIDGVNDLKTLRPDLINEFDINNKVSITSLTLDSTKRVNWKCKSCNNIYKMSVKLKVKGKKCPICKK